MEHPNIISVYDVGLKCNNEPYFTMELKVGHSLSQLMNKDKIALTDLLEIFKDMRRHILCSLFR